MPRPKGSGNPEAIKPHQWKAKGSEPLLRHYQVRLSESMSERLDALGSSKHDFVRDAIAVALDVMEQ